MIESVQIRFVIVEGSKWQRLDGSVKTRSGTFTHRTGRARQAEGGASSGVESGQNPQQFWPGFDPNKTVGI